MVYDHERARDAQARKDIDAYTMLKIVRER
jgi:hypothetical protein